LPCAAQQHSIAVPMFYVHLSTAYTAVIYAGLL